MPDSNDLEKRLGQSRRNIIPGLSAPAGGWEKIRAELPVERKSVPPASASFLPVAWIVVGLLLLTVAFYLSVQGFKAESSPVVENQKAGLTDRAVVASPVERPSPDISTQREENQHRVPAIRPGRTAVSESQMPEENILRNTPTDPGSAVDALPSGDVTGEHLASAQETVITEPEEDAEDQRSGNYRDSLVHVSGADNPESARPVEIPVASIPAGELMTLPNDLTSLEPKVFPGVFGDKKAMEKLSRLAKKQGEWQVLANYSSIFSYYPYGFSSQLFDRGVGQYGSIFILPNGESVDAMGQRSVGADYRANSFYFRTGISRQTASGFLFHLGAGAYKGYHRRRNDEFALIGENEIRVDSRAAETVLTTSLGLQYTFFHRRRFRPYLGVEALGFLYYKGESSKSFFDERTQTAGLVSSFNVKDYFPNYLDFALIGGFQYKVTPRVSAGCSLFFNGGYDLFLEAPVGLEIRYSLK